jgi:2-methylcitrate dehydratase PrpD
VREVCPTETLGVTEEMSDFIVSSGYECFPPKAVDLAKRCIIDGLGVMVAGMREPSVQIIREYVHTTGGARESTILGRGKERAPAHLAALVNGIAGHAMDWDDTALSTTPDRGVLLHPTVPPLAAGLAIGEVVHASGRDLVTAFLLGFEVECKLAEAISTEHRIRGFHTTGTCGIFGAVVTASKLMRLSRDRVRMALGIAASMSAGIDVQLGTMTKPLHAGRAAENAVVAARLASIGFEANAAALEGHKGFFQAYGPTFDAKRISGRLGSPFSILDPGSSVKPYPCGVVGQVVMDSMRDLLIMNPFRHEDVRRIRVTTSSNILPPAGPLKYRKAENALQGKFCVPFQMAAIVIKHKAGMMEFTDDFVKRPEVQDMMDRVETAVDPSFDALGRNRYMSVIEVHLRNGAVVKGKSPETVRGSPGNPLNREDLLEKFNDCVQETLGGDQARGLVATVDSVEGVTDVGELVRRASVD